jgi:hypothetical protein
MPVDMKKEYYTMWHARGFAPVQLGPWRTEAEMNTALSHPSMAQEIDLCHSWSIQRTLTHVIQILWISTGNYLLALKDDGSVWKADDPDAASLVWVLVSPPSAIPPETP